VVIEDEALVRGVLIGCSKEKERSKFAALCELKLFGGLEAEAWFRLSARCGVVELLHLDE
jgi:hypothetical protein